ncbi:hypothetical protein [Lysobacter antibioticus]|uniref:hypothetical protein n=1 Tax=Lysobacter antibioticus TaxID=84531 RepID=UPI00114070FC|nr:hypothetical protein [Lysobacter antibioticus]
MSQKKTIARTPLTDAELERLGPDDIAYMKLSSDELARLRLINEARATARAYRTKMIGIEQMPILAELRAVGVDTESIWTLLKRTTPYPEAIPILLKHLQLPYSDVTRDGLARALAVPEPEVRRAWAILVEQYRSCPFGLGFVAPADTEMLRLGAKDGLACALSAAVTEETLPELIELLRDSSNGNSRVLLLSPLKKLRKKSEHVRSVLAELIKDPDLVTEISSWK